MQISWLNHTYIWCLHLTKRMWRFRKITNWIKQHLEIMSAWKAHDLFTSDITLASHRSFQLIWSLSSDHEIWWFHIFTFLLVRVNRFTGRQQTTFQGSHSFINKLLFFSLSFNKLLFETHCIQSIALGFT